MINITSVSINNISVWSTSNKKESKVKHINGIKVSAISHTKGQSARFLSSSFVAFKIYNTIQKGDKMNIKDKH